jgi:alcohol dehydrogenase (cytochrome c)
MWALDAEDGEFLWARDTSAQTLIESIDDKGIVTVDEDKILKTIGEPVDWCPSHSGGRDWPPSSYNPETNIFFIP